jgi:hypothetical protein
MKPSYGRPFFVCSDKAKACSFWAWDDVEIPSRPHGRKFFCWPNDKENSCKYFDLVPEESYYDANLLQPFQNKSTKKREEHYLTNAFINDFNSLNISTFYQ